MANYKKSFNFRNGVQVDDNNFIVNANGLVGIGTSIPTEVLDVRGNLVVSGITTTNELYVTGVSTLSGNVLVGTGVTIFSSLGIVSATSFRGDGTQLTGISGSKWKVDAIAGLTTTSDVGIGTTDPVDKFQVGENPVTGVGVGIDSRGQAYFSGITTAGAYSTSGFVKTGDLNVTGVSTLAGTLDVDGDTQVDDLNVAGVATFSSLIDANNRLDVVGGANIDQINVSGVSTFTGIVTTVTDLYVGGDLYVNDDIEFDEVTARLATFTGTIDANGSLDVDGDTQLDDLNVAGVATFGAAVEAEAKVTIDGELFVASNIKHTGDTDTYIEFTADKMRFIAGGKALIDATEAGTDSVTINDGGNNLDFRVEGLNDEYQIFSDGGTDKVGIGSSVPGAKLDVAGTLNVTGVSTFSSAVDINSSLDVDGDTQLDDLNVAGVATFATHINLGDDDQIVLGVESDSTSGQFRIYHDNANINYIDSPTNRALILKGNEGVWVRGSGNENIAQFHQTEGVNLYFNQSKKLNTVGTGVSVLGQLSVASLDGGTSSLSTVRGALQYGNENASFPYSTRRSVDLLNYDTGNVNFYLDANNIASNVGAFYWHKGSNTARLMTLTSGGNLGIGLTLPEYPLHVSGIATCTNFFTSNDATINNDLSVGGDLSVTGSLTANVKGDLLSPDGTTILDNGTGSGANSIFKGNLAVTTGISTFAKLNVTGVSTFSSVTSNQTGTGTSAFTLEDVGLLGIGTMSPDAVLDLSNYARDNTALRRYRCFIPPKVSNSDRAHIESIGLSTISGSIIYNTDSNRLEVYNGGGWCGIATIV